MFYQLTRFRSYNFESMNRKKVRMGGIRGLNTKHPGRDPPVDLEPVLRNKRSHHNERPAHHD